MSPLEVVTDSEYRKQQILLITKDELIKFLEFMLYTHAEQGTIMKMNWPRKRIT